MNNRNQQKIIKNVILIAVIVGILLTLVKIQLQKSAMSQQESVKIEIPTPTPFVFPSYIPPKIEKKAQYSIVMIGDSMTHALGPHGGTFNTFINDLYRPDNIGILIDNYG